MARPTAERSTAPDPAPLTGPDRPVTLAAVVGPHGVGGEVRLKLFTDDLGAYTVFNGGALTLKQLREGPNGAIARFAEVADRNAAEALRGTALTVPRSALPALEEGEYYHHDLIDLPVVSEAGEAIGRVVQVADFGAGDVLEIERADGGTFMVPMRLEAVPEWSAERLVVADGWAE